MDNSRKIDAMDTMWIGLELLYILCPLIREQVVNYTMPGKCPITGKEAAFKFASYSDTLVIVEWEGYGTIDVEGIIMLCNGWSEEKAINEMSRLLSMDGKTIYSLIEPNALHQLHAQYSWGNPTNNDSKQ